MRGEMSYERDIAEIEASHDRACIQARYDHHVPDPENFEVDCETECPLHLTACPFNNVWSMLYYNRLGNDGYKLTHLITEYMDHDTSSEKLTGDIKLQLINTILDLKNANSNIEATIKQLYTDINQLKLLQQSVTSMIQEYHYNGMDRIKRILDYRSRWSGIYEEVENEQK
jgi:hypothetical protein